MSKLSRPEAVIFDWDNTLVDTWPIIHKALEDTFAALDKECWSFETTKKCVKKSMRDSFPEIFGEDWQRAGEMYQVHYRKHHLENLTPLTGAEDILKAFKALDIPMFVVSNKKGGNLRQEIAHLGWGHYFKNIVGSDDAAKDKPYPEPVIHALKPHGHIAGAHIWFVGDSDIDLECAKNTGCTPILYGEFAAQQAEFTPTHYLGAPYTAFVKDHETFAELFKQW